ncbi:peptidyl-prolyl cis-trans isomerase [Candida orthopsilosis Co 90-125]|uniref:Peptidyl-prolyl cis-trans isomerase n=1 Tax=Candida orthopsilosis (strain 90-125) TaxID=1136231 RepID=H8X5S4_CANO9|nr:peptidyl-prolyl cis-trans isomerase [Candida orthopsilosis Co 90-125]CCG23532.1 peptidyl-prolyl cis-trans isomerase [Candida orthopsilosis Co 90-125]
MNTRSILFVILIYITTLVTPTVIPHVETFQLSEDEMKHLVDDPKVTHKVTFTISQKQPDSPNMSLLGKLTLALFGEVCPITVDNFYQLSAMTRGYGYKDSQFHRIINNFMIQGGNYDGQGGKSIYGGSFNDENFKLKHDKLGRLSMANAGANTNGGQFFILNVDKTPHLDGKHVVFGQLVGGFDTLMRISTVEVDGDSKPLDSIIIADVETAKLSTDPQNGDELESSAKLEEAKPKEDEAKIEQVVQTSSVYPWLIVLLLIGIVGGTYYRKIHKAERITDIRGNRRF